MLKVGGSESGDFSSTQVEEDSGNFPAVAKTHTGTSYGSSQINDHMILEQSKVCIELPYKLTAPYGILPLDPCQEFQIYWECS